jgi:hypothetical protein
MKSIYFTLPAIIALFAVSGCSTDTNCSQIVNAKCISCHSIKKTCNKTGNSKGYWETTVNQMIRLSVQLTDDEQKRIVNCLAGSKTFDSLCN